MRRVACFRFGLVLTSVAVAVTLLGSSSVSVAATCPFGSFRDSDGFIHCVESESGGRTSYANPPEHQPTRCEKLAPVDVLDSEGKKVPIPKTNPIRYKTKRYSELVPVSLGIEVRGKVTGRLFRLFSSYCQVPGNPNDTLVNSQRAAWVKVVSNENMVEDLLVEVSAQLTNVTMTWPTLSPKHGWQMVKVPLEIRGVVPAPVSRSMSAANLTRPEGLTVSITASPAQVKFVSGDNDRPVTCPVEQLSWNVPDPEHPTACSYTYLHSSVQREGRPFKTEVYTVWEVTTPVPSLNRPWTLSAVEKDLLVAEAQALVTG